MLLAVWMDLTIAVFSAGLERTAGRERKPPRALSARYRGILHWVMGGDCTRKAFAIPGPSWQCHHVALLAIAHSFLMLQEGTAKLSVAEISGMLERELLHAECEGFGGPPSYHEYFPSILEYHPDLRLYIYMKEHRI